MFSFADKNMDGKLSFSEFEVRTYLSSHFISHVNCQVMMRPQSPPETVKPHITDIGMMPQLFSPPVHTKQEIQSNYASPILPASKGTFSSRSSLASFKPSSANSATVKMGSVTSSTTNIANL